MTTIDEQLEKVISEERIYKSKLAAHLDWKNASNKHLIVVTTILEKRYILVDVGDQIDLNSIGKKIYFYEVLHHNENGTPYKGVSNKIDELDWLGEFSFLLKTEKFQSHDDRNLLEENMDALIFLQNAVEEGIGSLRMDLRIGYNRENNKWGFCWVKHDHPFYLKEGLLCPKKNCVTEGLGIVWCAKKDAEFILHQISLVTRKFNKKGSIFTQYPTITDFLAEFLQLMKMISNKTMNPIELEEWSRKVLSGYSIS